MSLYISILLWLALQILIFGCFGIVMLRLGKRKKYPFGLSVAVGYFGYFALFECIAFPMKIFHGSLTLLAAAWAAVAAAIALLALWCLRSREKNKKHMISAVWGEHSFWIFAVLVCVGLQCLMVVFYQDYSADSAYYVGEATTAVYTDTLSRYNPYSGFLLETFNPRYVFSCYPLHNAVICRISGIHPLIQAKTIMAAVNVIVGNMIYYQIGKALFQEKAKAADAVVCLICLIQLFSNTIYTAGTFFFTRIYEGKAILANLVAGMILYCCIRLYQDVEDRKIWLLLFVCNLASIAFSQSAMFFPAAAAAGTLPFILYRRKLKQIGWLMFSVIPNLVLIVGYFLMKTGVITLYV